MSDKFVEDTEFKETTVSQRKVPVEEVVQMEDCIFAMTSWSMEARYLLLHANAWVKRGLPTDLKRLQKLSGLGRKRFTRAVAELRQHGCLTTDAQQDEDGRFTASKTVYDLPHDKLARIKEKLVAYLRRRYGTFLTISCGDTDDTQFAPWGLNRDHNTTPLKGVGRGVGEVGSGRVGIKREYKATSSGDVCRAFLEGLVLPRRWHMLPGRDRPRKGYTPDGLNTRTYNIWKRQEENLAQREKGGAPAVLEVLRWYVEHVDDPWTPVCQSFPTFAEKYETIRKAAIRDGLEIRDWAPGNEDYKPTWEQLSSMGFTNKQIVEMGIQKK
ncbi:MAG: hypothetical protein Unbinned3891contig1000_17 [Prokaryotic dsDNA virus sp.]|nr:MAG: hypothetical protein Unbinned3891contig1000_17 [Prokaryotic dsDNA virus sp.]|tara:strand:- start:15966 stop:16943 length:978 start_codon:yes stop_codon:yes gene_type:complete